MKRVLNWWKELNIKWVSNDILSVLDFIGMVASVIYMIGCAVTYFRLKDPDKKANWRFDPSDVVEIEEDGEDE